MSVIKFSLFSLVHCESVTYCLHIQHASPVICAQYKYCYNNTIVLLTQNFNTHSTNIALLLKLSKPNFFIFKLINCSHYKTKIPFLDLPIYLSVSCAQPFVPLKFIIPLNLIHSHLHLTQRQCPYVSNLVPSYLLQTLLSPDIYFKRHYPFASNSITFHQTGCLPRNDNPFISYRRSEWAFEFIYPFDKFTADFISSYSCALNVAVNWHRPSQVRTLSSIQ